MENIEFRTVNPLPILHLIATHWEVETGFHSCLCRLPARAPEQYKQMLTLNGLNLQKFGLIIDGPRLKFLSRTIRINHKLHKCKERSTLSQYKS